MIKVAFLSSDSRLAFQVKDWMRDLVDDVKFERFHQLEAFRAYIEKPLTPLSSSPPTVDVAKDTSPSAETPPETSSQTPSTSTPPAPAAVATEVADLEYTEIGLDRTALRLLIVDLELIEQRPFQWLAETRALLREHGHSDPGHPTRVLAMAFEGGRHSPAALRHETIDDLVLKPLDRSLFMQKVEILVSDTPDVKPSFLFRQTTSQMIEAGKDVVIDEISEFAIAIRNPAPLAEGVFAAIYADVFGEKSDSRVLARAYNSVRHPTHEGEYLVRFVYFGISDHQLTNVRKYVRAHMVSVRMRHQTSPVSAAAAVRREDWLPGLPQWKIAVIDMNRSVFSEITTAIESTFRGVKVQVFPSYSRFLAGLVKLLPHEHEHGEKAAEESGSMSTETNAQAVPVVETGEHGGKKTVPALPGGRKLAVTLAADTQELIKFDPVPRKGERVLGHSADEWFQKVDLWKSSVEKGSREEFDEFLVYIASGAQGTATIRMVDADGRLVCFEVVGSLEKAGEVDGRTLIRVEVREIDENAYGELSALSVQSSLLDVSAFHFDAIFIDGAVLRNEPGPWLEGLNELMIRAGVLWKGEAFPKVFILADEKSTIRPESFRVKGISGFIMKPIDRKFTSLEVEALIPGLRRIEEPDVSPFVPCEMPARLAKDVMMSELSEYGLAVINPSPFREKVFMRFFSPLFGESNEGVIGRCTHCEPLDKDGKSYKCHFIFFGGSDDFLRRIRTWIREDYVARKDGTG